MQSATVSDVENQHVRHFLAILDNYYTAPARTTAAQPEKTVTTVKEDLTHT